MPSLTLDSVRDTTKMKGTLPDFGEKDSTIHSNLFNTSLALIYIISQKPGSNILVFATT